MSNPCDRCKDTRVIWDGTKLVTCDDCNKKRGTPMVMCQSYCSHGGRCELDRGHDGLHDSNYCTWTDADALTKTAADRVLSTKQGGRDYLMFLDPMAEMIESMIDETGDDDV